MSSRTLLCLFLASISLLPQAFAQDTTLTTYRQSYGRLLAIDRCAQRLQVSDIDSFSVGTSVLIIQHQGATIREENNAEFGTITDLGGAGRYEINRITAIDADELVLAQRPRYDYRIDGTTQVVGVSPLDNATVTAPISPRAFDGETGGVLFFDIRDTLRLEAALRADGVGFRGGLGEIDPDENCTFLSSRSRYFYGADDERAARKGEGIARFIPGKEAGRGPQANGGGGGNAHNSGGGGGANVTVAGQGGENLEPDFFGCDGDFPGLSGRSLPATDTLLFFGGGGGAGHANNSAFGGGGNGGGIVVIRAAAIVFGSNGQISAAGTTAETIDGDGAGGGGSGGSIRLQYDTLIGTPNLSVRGGDGGNVDANGNRCQGPGGGGSGGWIGAATLLNGDLTGGSAGEVLASSACTDGNLTPGNGLPGLSVLLTDTLPTGIDTLQVDFDFSVTDLTVTFENLTTDSLATWLWDFGDTNTSTERDPVHTYTAPGSYVVTLIATDACGSVSASQEVNLTEDAAPTAAFTVDNASGCAPLTVQFTNQSIQAESYQWSFPGGSPATSTEPSPTVTFANAGTYIAQLFVSNALGSSETSLSIEVGEPPVAAFDFTTTEQTVSFDAGAAVGDAFAWEFGDGTTATGTTTTHTYPLDTLYTARLIVSSACGSDTLEQLIDLLPPLPTAAFSTDPAVGCAPLQVQFTSQSEGVATYDWSFPGGTPATSSDVAPSVSYLAAGIYPVTLIVRNTAGADTLTLAEAIDVSTAPVADFAPGIPDGLTVAFTNNSTDATSFAWQFGDNSLSPEADPTHTFEGCGTYRVRLIASNPTCGADTTFQDIVISGCPVADFEQNLTSGCAPLAVQFSNTSTGEYETFAWTFPGGEPSNSTEAAPIVIFSEPGSYEVVLELQSSFGTQVASQTIQVTAPPAPTFESTVSGLTVTFQNQTPEADSYSWDFGDGNSSNAASPVHTYATGGVYTVSLNAQLGSCGKAVSRNVVVGSTDTEDLARAGIRVFPNPVSDRIRVEGFAGGSLYLFSSDGRLVRRLEATGETTVLPREDLPAGMYWLRLVRNEQVYGLALVLR